MKKYLILTGVTLACLITSLQIQAQPCKSVNAIGINTGYDYSTNTPVVTPQPDPQWRVTMLTPACAAISGGVPVGGHALSASNTWGAYDPNSRWISFNSSGLYTTTGGAPDYTYGMTLSRDFKVCKDDKFLFTLQIANDNFCTEINIDGISIGFSQPAGMPTSNHTSFTTITPFTEFLTQGTHTINVTVYNYPLSQTSINGHALNLLGTIQSVAGYNSLTDPQSPQDCICTSSCSDSCYWKVSGNNIIGGNNTFGTLNEYDIVVKTNNSERGVITQGGANQDDMNAGRLGWNTMKPTARLHVDCQFGNNKDNKEGDISDIRFENLEPGKGSLLVIDEKGYVYNSRTDLNKLLEEIAALRAEVAALRGERAGKATPNTGGNLLKQNVPNPFNKETVIEYEIQDITQVAYIIIYDLSGKQIQKYPVEGTAKGRLVIDGAALNAGMYLYSLVINGKEVDTKRMVLVK